MPAARPPLPQVILQSRFNGQFCRLAPNIVNLTILQLALLCDQPTINLAMQFNYTGAPLSCIPWQLRPDSRPLSRREGS